MADPGQIVCHNAYLHDRLAAQRTLLNVGHWLYLFVNDVEPDSATPIGAFANASFPGSDPVSLDGLWSAPVKQQDGEYTISIPTQLYTCTGPASETVYGFYVQTSGVLAFSGRMIAPIPVSSGISFNLKLQFVDRDFSLGV